MKDLIEIANDYPDITLAVKAGELIEAIEYCVQKTRKELEQQITDSKTETYPSQAEVAKILKVDISTLWRWKKKGYLVPIEIGGKRRYKMSEITKLLKEQQ